METNKPNKTVYDIEAIKRRLPHRYPFLMVDRIIESRPGICVGIKNVTINEAFFSGHFPQFPIMPGNLMAEAMAQVAAFVEPPAAGGVVDPPSAAFLAAMNIKFQKPVLPGDQLLIQVRLLKKIGNLTAFEGEVKVDGEIVAKGSFSIAFNSTRGGE